MDKSHLPCCATQNIAVLAFKCRTSNDGIFFPIFCLLRHPVTQIAQPWVTVFIRQRNTGTHLVAVGLGMKIVSFSIRTLVEMFLQRQRGSGFTATTHAHHDKMCRHFSTPCLSTCRRNGRCHQRGSGSQGNGRRTLRNTQSQSHQETAQ